MVQLNEEWRAWAAKHAPERCLIKAIYGTEDKVIPMAQASDYEGEAVPLFEDHIGIVKPSNKDSEIAKTIIRFLSDSGFASYPAMSPDPKVNVLN
jgi:hypothetical protein